MVAPERVADSVVDQALLDLPGWSRVGAELRCCYALSTFAQSVAFTNRIAELADQLAHHPEWTVAYSKVTLSMTTHDAGGLSSRDLSLAARIVLLAKGLGAKPVASERANERGATWVPPGHFYSPIVDGRELAADADKLFAPGLRELRELDLRVPEQIALARELAKFYGQ